METRADDVEKEGALHALLITLADASTTLKQMQRQQKPCRATLALHLARTMADVQCETSS